MRCGAYLFRRDPRDSSVIYVYDPELKEYFAIPYRNTAFPAISLWELREVKRRLQEAGQQTVTDQRRPLDWLYPGSGHPEEAR